jgi:act minimal PKS acyl carrier protein
MPVATVTPIAAFTLDDLKRIFVESAGAPTDVDQNADILDTEFGLLGYDSLALLETASRIEREYGIALNDADFVHTTTPRTFLGVVAAARLADRVA